MLTPPSEPEKPGKETLRGGIGGIVEWSLFFVLILFVVIAVLTLMGPAIGNSFSNIVKGL
jgi:hypothetical protein